MRKIPFLDLYKEDLYVYLHGDVLLYVESCPDGIDEDEDIYYFYKNLLTACADTNPTVRDIMEIIGDSSFNLSTEYKNPLMDAEYFKGSTVYYTYTHFKVDTEYGLVEVEAGEDAHFSRMQSNSGAIEFDFILPAARAEHYSKTQDYSTS
jgi:hypothetical protein